MTREQNLINAQRELIELLSNILDNVGQDYSEDAYVLKFRIAALEAEDKEVEDVSGVIEFAEWMGDADNIDFEEDGINPFMRHKGRWIQACGNSTSWTTEQLYKMFKEQSIKTKK